MSKHFSSVLRLVKIPREGVTTKGAKEIRPHDGGRSVTLPGQPLPPSQGPSPKSDEAFTVDHVFTSGEDDQTVYKHSVKEIVEATLLGYHGTVISFGTGSTRTLRDHTDGAIHRAARQILRCLRKSKRTQAEANLSVRCSFVAVIDENVHDLLQGYGSEEEWRGGDEGSSQAAKKLQVLKSSIIGARIQEAKSTAKVMALLKHGTETERKLLQGSRAEGSPGTSTHHSVFQLTVAYTRFGSMNAPISGNLSFVDVGTARPLADRTTEEMRRQPTYRSLFTFADTVMALTPSAGELNQASRLTVSLDDDMAIPNMPSVPATDLYSQSMLTQILQEALGGNCKTLLISHVASDPISSANYVEAYRTLRLAERARCIQNSPNKRDLAEKALMAAYMKELHHTYGNRGRRQKEGESPTFDVVEELTPSSGGCTNDPVMETLTSEERKRNVELAASALAAAALNEGGSSEEEDDADTPPSTPTRTSAKPAIRLTKKRKAKKPRPPQLAMLQGLESASSSSLSAGASGDVTIDALVAILQHPDRGVPRASHTVLRDVKIRKDIGALFSGADIVRWMVENVAGVESGEDAERLGQLLLDKGAIIHSEESRVFANAESLFYYATYAPTSSRVLSTAEIQALLAKTEEEPLTANVTNVNVESEGGGEDNRGSNHGSREKTPVSPLSVADRSGDLVLDEYDEFSTEEATDGLQQDPGHPGHTSPEEQAPGYGGKGLVNASLHSPSSGYHSRGSMGTTDLHTTTGHEEVELYTSAVGDTPEQETGSQPPTSQDPLQDTEAEEHEEDEEEHAEASEPDTAPVDTIPVIQTIENTEDYPHPLHMAVAIGKSPGVIRNLVMMFGVDKQDEQGRTPLMFAVLANKRSACLALIECGANVNHCDLSGITAIQVACYHGHKEVLSLLLSKKASLAVVDKMGHSVVHWSTVPESSSCLQQIISRVSGNMVLHTDKRKLSALHWAIHYDHAEHLKLLLKRYESPLQLDLAGHTFMTFAIHKNATNCIKVLAALVPTLLSHPDSDSLTPLHHVSGKSSPELLKLLLSFPVPKGGNPLDVNCVDQYNRTPLHCAVYLNRLHSALVLLNNGAQLDVADAEGRTPMDYAKDLDDSSPMIAVLKGDLSAINEESIPESNATSKLPNSKACSML